VPSVRILRPPAPGEVEIIRSLEDAARARDGHEALASSMWRDLATPTAESTGLLATEGGRPVGYLHLAPSDTLADPHLVAGLVVDPDHRTADVTSALFDALGPEIARRGGGRVVLWINGADHALDEVVTAVGFRRLSEQFQMRVPLPPAESPRWPAGIAVRAFVPGQDDGDWLRVNNRAFAAHPDQGGWSEETLKARTAESWFDPAGFLLAYAGEERSAERARSAQGEATHKPALAGFCWTKVHEAEGEEPRLGEIYVIGVDPDHQGTGLGRALTVAGLEHLADVQGCRTGMLYVDGANRAALGLYRALGFEVHRSDRAYELEVAP
jgi:mycothiol synthase